MNVEADRLSRAGQVLSTEWCLDRSALDRLFRQVGTPEVDLFATYRNAVVPRFVSPFPDPRALAVDALALDWSHRGLMYAFPPWKLIPEVIRKWRVSRGITLILVTPMRSIDSWVPELLSEAVTYIPLESVSSTPVSGRGRHRPEMDAGGGIFTDSRLDTFKAVITYTGYDEQVASLMARYQRESTCRVYQKYWRKFFLWCQSHAISLDSVNGVILARFFTELFYGGINPSTIKGYRSAIAPIYRVFSGYDAGQDQLLTGLFRRFVLERPRVPKVFPEWDLAVVLEALLRPPFVSDAGSDREISLRLFTFKTAFLLSLASGLRVSCLRALALDFTVHRGSAGQRILTLHTLPGYRSKNQRPSDLPVPIVVPGIAHLMPGELERLLCPVRCVECYAYRTQQLHRRRGCARLFTHFLEDVTTDIKVSHISRWVVFMIRLAYRSADLPVPGQTRAHEVRAVSSSWAFFNDVPLDQIKQTLVWKTDGVFQNHYLRAMASSATGLRRLGPLVVAGTVVS